MLFPNNSILAPDTACAYLIILNTSEYFYSSLIMNCQVCFEYVNLRIKLNINTCPQHSEGLMHFQFNL